MLYSVAPFVGAWIETFRRGRWDLAFLSHPLWVRGLKQELWGCINKKGEVAPFVGAWIET